MPDNPKRILSKKPGILWRIIFTAIVLAVTAWGVRFLLGTYVLGASNHEVLQTVTTIERLYSVQMETAWTGFFYGVLATLAVIGAWLVAPWIKAP